MRSQPREPPSPANRKRRWAIATLALTLLGALWWLLYETDEPHTTRGLNRELEAPAPSPAAILRGRIRARSAGAVPATVDAIAPDELTVDVFGTVVDERYDPVPAASVTVMAGESEVGSSVADALGQFHFLVPVEDLEPPGRVVVLARSSPDRAAHKTIALRPSSWWGRKGLRSIGDCGELVLRSAHDLRVKVLSTMSPGEPVTISLIGDPQRFGDGTCREVSGVIGAEVLVPMLPEGEYRVVAHASGIGRGSAKAYVADSPTETVEVLLSAGQAVQIRVLTQEGTPIEGASLEVLEAVPWPDGYVPASRAPQARIGPTDSAGLAHIEHVGPRDSFWVFGTAAGFADPSSWGTGPGRVKIGPGTREATLRLARIETVEWNIDTSVGSPPDDGTAVQLYAPCLARTGLPRAGRVENGKVKVAGIGSESVDFIAIASNGAIARLKADPQQLEGGEVTFLDPRRLSLTLTYSDGAPVTAVALCVVCGPHCFGGVLRPDGSGRISLSNLPASRGRIHILELGGVIPWSGAVLGEFDIRDGDASLRVLLPDPQLIRLRCIPPWAGAERRPLRIEIGGRLVNRVDEDGTIAFWWQPPTERARATLSVLWEGGRRTEVSVSARDASPREIEVRPPEIGRHLVAHIRLPAGWGCQLILQRWLAERGLWSGERGHGGRRITVGMDGELRLDRLENGRYRILYERYGLFSNEVEISLRPNRIDFDLSRVAYVRGTVLGQAGKPVLGSSVRVSRSAFKESGLSGEDYTSLVSVSKSGKFRALVVRGRATKLEPRHPKYSPAGGTASVTVYGPRTDVVLRLAEGPRASIRLTPEDEAGASLPNAAEARVFLREAGNSFRPVSARIENGVLHFAGFEPGEFSVWIDLVRFAPVILERVELRQGLTDLGNVQLSQGASVVLRTIAPAGTKIPIIQLSARAVGSPSYERVTRGAEKELRLRGLAAGRFEVRALPVGRGQELLSTTVEVRAGEERVLTLDLR